MPIQCLGFFIYLENFATVPRRCYVSRILEFHCFVGLYADVQMTTSSPPKDSTFLLRVGDMPGSSVFSLSASVQYCGFLKVVALGVPFVSLWRFRGWLHVQAPIIYLKAWCALLLSFVNSGSLTILSLFRVISEFSRSELLGEFSLGDLHQGFLAFLDVQVVSLWASFAVLDGVEDPKINELLLTDPVFTFACFDSLHSYFILHFVPPTPLISAHSSALSLLIFQKVSNSV